MKLILKFGSKESTAAAAEELETAVVMATGDSGNGSGYYDRSARGVIPALPLPGMANDYLIHRAGWSGSEYEWTGWTRSSGTVLAWNIQHMLIGVAGTRHSITELLPKRWKRMEWVTEDPRSRHLIDENGRIFGRVGMIDSMYPDEHPFKPTGAPR